MKNFVVLGSLLTTAHLLAGGTPYYVNLDPRQPTTACCKEGEFYKLPPEMLSKIAENLSPEALQNLRTASSYFHEGLEHLKPYIIRKALVKHFRENPIHPWHAPFLLKVHLKSIPEAIKAFPKNLKMTRPIFWDSEILADKPLEEILAFLKALPDDLKMTDPLFRNSRILQGKPLEDISKFLKGLPERLNIIHPLYWDCAILKDKSAAEIRAFNDTLPDNLKMTDRLSADCAILYGKSLDERDKFNRALPLHLRMI